MWPAMWGWAFYADDPENEKTADEMGVVMSTSHHEPMARNHQEYARNRKGWGPWNYQKNKTNLQKFFREGIERMKGTEQIVTIGMRGDGDEAMNEEADTKLMTNIINDQRKIIADVTGRKASETPQVWALYKEVMDYYDKGMKVPDDVTLLLCDDNWGNVRRVPNAKERKHKGGWGLYYHVDYVGAPRNSKMLNVTPVQNPWEQLTLAYENGIDRLWILNVGDLKPMEYPISQFMDMAWNPRKYDVNNITRHTRDWCAQQFGESQADEAARILNLICKYNGRCTPEMLDKNRVLAITKCDLLDEELIEMLKETLPTDLPVVFISSVTGQGIQELKDVLWKELNSESNKLQEITAEDTLVHRDKDMSRFQQELAAEGEDVVEYIDEDEIEDVDDLDDFEYE